MDARIVILRIRELDAMALLGITAHSKAIAARTEDRGNSADLVDTFVIIAF
jgi:hypothetical protein